MRIKLDSPYFLLILPVLLLAVLIPYIRRARRNRTPVKYRISLGMRLLAALLAVLALSGFHTVTQTKENSVVVLADLSDSTKNTRKEMTEYVKRIFEYADQNTAVGLMTFGYDTSYELPVQKRHVFQGFATAPRAGHTNIADALMIAAAMLPSDTNRRIILLTDGKQTVGDAVRTARTLTSQGIRVDAVLLNEMPAEYEVQVSDIRLPNLLYQGEAFDLTVTVESTCATEAVLRLYHENILLSQRDITLQAGKNRFIFTEKAEASGVAAYTVEIETARDDIMRNNRMYSYVRVLGTPNILVVDGTGEESRQLCRILDGAVRYTVSLPESVPVSMTELRKYDGVVLMNTSREQLPQDWEILLEQYVRGLGRGVLAVGGDRSYVFGGWADTKLEEMLPVNMYIQDETENPDIALMLLIDNSGSMGEGAGSALELAKEGARRAVNVLKKTDEVGVLSFSDNAVWIAKPTSAAEKDAVINQIGTIPPGGGTMMSNAVHLAYDALCKSDKKVKHMIILSDGQPGDEAALVASGITGKMLEHQITLTTIAVGDGANTELMKRLAEETEGRCYNAVDAASLPEIMLQETILAMGEYMNNVTFTPIFGASSPVTEKLTSFSELDGYIGTELKQAARMVLSADEKRPVYAEWQYGLGFAAAFTSDLSGKWSGKLLQWEHGAEFILNMVNRILPGEEDPSTGIVTADQEGDKGFISVVSPYTDKNYQTEASVITPEGKELTVPLTLSGLGTYEGSFPLSEDGNYTINVTQKDGTQTVMRKDTVLASSYSDEYHAFLSYSGVVEAVCAASGGRIYRDIRALMKIKLEGAEEYHAFTELLLVLVTLLLLADIAVRRLNLTRLFTGALQKAGHRDSRGQVSGQPRRADSKTPQTAVNPAERHKMIKRGKEARHSTQARQSGGAVYNGISSAGEKMEKKNTDNMENEEISSLLKIKEQKGRKKL